MGTLTSEEALALANAYTDEHSGGGGGGGTTDYNALTNKPKINGKTLSSTTTATSLGLVEVEDGKGLSSNDYTDLDKTEVEKIKDKVDKVAGKGLSTNDLTDSLKSQYDKAEENVQSDWSETDATSDAYIKNKPTIPDAVNIATLFGTTTSDDKVPSEKLVKSNLDLKADTTEVTEKLSKKVDIQQDVADEGKALIVGADGKLLLGTVATDGLEIVDKKMAKYEALTEEEKNDATKLYNITDAEVEDLTKYATKEYVNNKVGENIKIIKVDIADIPMSGTDGKYYTTINFTDNVPDGYFPISFFERGIWDETINFVLNINEETRMFRLDIKSSISAVTMSNASPLNIVCMKMFS